MYSYDDRLGHNIYFYNTSSRCIVQVRGARGAAAEKGHQG